MLNYLSDEMFFQHYKSIKEYVSLEQVKIRCTNFYKTQESPLIPEVKERSIQSIKETGLNEWGGNSQLRIYRENPDFYQALSNREQTYIPCLIKLIENYPDDEKRLMNELLNVLTRYDFISGYLWRLVPEHLIKKEPLWTNAPQEFRLSLINSDEIIQENISLLKADFQKKRVLLLKET